MSESKNTPQVCCAYAEPLAGNVAVFTPRARRCGVRDNHDGTPILCWNYGSLHAIQRCDYYQWAQRQKQLPKGVSSS